MIILNNAQLTKNFKLSEMKCKCGCDSVILRMDGIKLLQQIRDNFDRAVTVCSNYRCKKWNKQVGGTENSYHLLGMAWDIKVSGVSPSAVARYAKLIGFKGIGCYTNNGNSFVHVDIRETPSYWVDKPGSNKLISVSKF